MAVRRAHLVGSIPGSDASEAMSLALDRLGDHLDFLPDGETGVRRNWIIGMIETFRHHPALQLVRDGDWSAYDRTPRFRVRSGQRLYGAALDLGITAAARHALPIYRTSLAARAGGAHPVFQVGIPGDVDLATFTFGPTGPVRHLRPFTEALVATMRAVHDLAEGEVLFQIEIPVELVLLARTPRPARGALAALFARRVAALVLGVPVGVRFGVHLCLGDMNHRALGRLVDAEPLVRLSNAIVASWPAGRTLEYVHAPFAAADDPPVDDPAFYRPLRGLRLRNSRLVAGYAHEDRDLAAQHRIRRYIEDAVGGPVDVSTSCGLGRRDPGAAVAAMDRIGALLAD